jgi:NitT/TauT family transport system ATP-binding protein
MTLAHEVQRAGLTVSPDQPPLATGISFRGVSKAFTSQRDSTPFLAVRDVNLDVEPGRFVCLIGPSGSGKSTLLNMVAGLFRPTRGTVHQDGHRITKVNTRVGYITQQDNLLPWRTLQDNVALSLEIQGVKKSERANRVAHALEEVALTGFENHYPSQLSGGMRKRATLARTLVYSPDTLLMDEPFGALDAMMKNSLQEQLLSLWDRDRKTVLFVTHDLDEAILLADDIVVFGTHPGRIVHVENVKFPRPRTLAEIRRTPEFTSMWESLWSLIESQMKLSGTNDPPGQGD